MTESDTAASLDEDGLELTKEEQVEAEKEQLLHALSSGKLDRVQERVAWVLNQSQKARDSDIALMLEYWETFEPDFAKGDSILKEDLYTLPRLTSLSRARAKIQNTYRLFEASPEIRRHRKQISAQELEKAIEQRATHPLTMVYADESGKTQKYLVVGSIWFLHPAEILTFVRELEQFKLANKFEREFHLKEISQKNLGVYLALVDWLATRANVVSFKALSVERAGVGNVREALERMFYHLLVRGIEHEDSTGRSPLPRRVQLWKDLEEVGSDKLFLADLADRLENAGSQRFGGKLQVGELEPVESHDQPLVQIADLFTSSIGRVLNAEGARNSPKDQFADELLSRLGLPHGPQQQESEGGMTMHVFL